MNFYGSRYFGLGTVIYRLIGPARVHPFGRYGKKLREPQEEGKFLALCRVSGIICKKPNVRINYKDGKVVCR